MFDQLLESSVVKRKASSPWAYGVSLAVQCLVVGVMILLPLLYTEALPKQEMLSWLVAPPPPPPPPPPPAAQPVKQIVRRTTLMEAGKLRAPREIPREIAMIKEDPLPEDVGVVGGVPGGVPGGQMGGVLGGVLGGIPSLAPPPQVTPQRIRVSSGVQLARRTRNVDPIFPPIAKQARISGVVRLEAVIAKDGSVQNLRVIQGHPLLVQAALEAVQQWRYQPTLLNNEPVEVITFIDIIFKLY